MIDTTTNGITTVNVGDLPVGVAIQQIPVRPIAPDQVSASVIPTGRLLVQWRDRSENELFFDVLRKAGGGGYSIRATLPANATSYSDAVLPNTTYTYVIRARNTAGTAPASPFVFLTPTLPAAPSDLDYTTPATDKVHLTWLDNASDEDYFYLERSSTAGTKVFKLPVDSVSYVDTLSDRTRVYRYRVRALSEIGFSPWSNTVEVPILPPPAAPSNLAATLSNFSRVNLTWEDNSNDESRFAIYRKPVGGFFALIRSVATNVTSYADVGVPAGTFIYKVLAVNPGGSSASEELQVVIPAAPAAPSGLNAERIGITVRLTWLDNSDSENNFVIERKTNEGNWVFLKSLPAGTTSYTDSTVRAGNTYHYRLRASNAGGYSGYSDPASIEFE